MAQFFDEYGNPIDMPEADVWGNMSAQIAAMNQAPNVAVEATPQGPTVYPQGGLSTADLEKMQFEAIEAEKKNLLRREKLQQDAYNTAIQSSQVDYSPLLSLIDTATGSNLSKGYKTPESISTKQERLNASEDRIQRGREAISDDRMNLIRAKLAQQASMQNSKLQADILKARLQSMSPDAPPKLTGEARGKVGGLLTSLETLKEMETRAEAGEGPRYLDANVPLVGQFIKDTQYEALARKLTDDIGRARSGGAINKDEEARFISMLPRTADMKDPALVKSKLATLRSEFGTRLQAYGVNEGNLGKLGFSPEKYSAGKAASKKAYDDMTDAELEALLKGK